MQIFVNMPNRESFTLIVRSTDSVEATMEAVLKRYEEIVGLELVPPFTIELAHLDKKLNKGRTLTHEGIQPGAVLTMELSAFAEGLVTQLANLNVAPSLLFVVFPT